MAKRFIDTNLFKKTFIRGLKAPLKVLWVYLFCDCSIAGIWEIDLEVASLYCGFKVTMDEIKIFNGKIIIFDEGKKLFIPDFIEFQYGDLNGNNPAHKNVIRELSKYQLIDEKYNVIQKAPSEHLPRCLNAPLEKEKEKDKEKENLTPENFYKNQLELSGNDITYKKYIDILFGVNEAGIKMSGILSMKEQLTFDQFTKLIQKAAVKNESLTKLSMSFENGNYYKGKKSLYLSLNDWLNKR